MAEVCSSRRECREVWSSMEVLGGAVDYVVGLSPTTHGVFAAL